MRASVGVVFHRARVLAAAKRRAIGLAEGDYVPFVLWFNFLAGFAYVAAGVGLFLRHRWAVWLAVAIVVSTLGIMVAFWGHVLTGGAYEQRTIWALALRSAVWGVIAAIALRLAARTDAL